MSMGWVEDGGDNDDDGGVGVGSKLVGAGDVELPIGSAELSVLWLMLWETCSP